MNPAVNTTSSTLSTHAEQVGAPYPLVCRMHILQGWQPQASPEIWQEPLQRGFCLSQCFCLAHGHDITCHLAAGRDEKPIYWAAAAACGIVCQQRLSRICIPSGIHLEIAAHQ
jgi:hypothetical protein